MKLISFSWSVDQFKTFKRKHESVKVEYSKYFTQICPKFHSVVYTAYKDDSFSKIQFTIAIRD